MLPALPLVQKHSLVGWDLFTAGRGMGYTAYTQMAPNTIREGWLDRKNNSEKKQHAQREEAGKRRLSHPGIQYN